jgi:hypothetical protein
MASDTETAGNVGTTKCVLEPRPQIWDLGGTLTATFADSKPADGGRPGTA